jgi:hypothetical protein
MSFLKKNAYKLAVLSFWAVLPVVSFAETTCDPKTQICNPIQATTINGVIKTFLEGALKVGMPVVALAIIYCGFLFVAANGNPEKLTKAKESLLYTLIGAGVLLGAWAIAELITETVKGLS